MSNRSESRRLQHGFGCSCYFRPFWRQVFKREIGELGNSEGLGHAPENAIPPDEMERRSMAKRRVAKWLSDHI